jgi:hypothetical protein
MVILEARRELQEALFLLLDGQMTNDEFDRLSDDWQKSLDRGVAEIAAFGHSLCSSGLLIPYRLKGWHAVDMQTRKTAERCLLFLETDLEYGWPDLPNPTWRNLVRRLMVFQGIPLGFALLLLGVLIGMDNGSWQAITFSLVPGGLTLVVSFLLLRWSRKQDTPEWCEYWSAGDRAVWPFLHYEDYSRSHYLTAERSSI